MFVNVINFPPVKAGKDKEFQDWFAWSNEEYRPHRGFVRRRLLRPQEGDRYVAVVEHDSHDTFMAMHRSPTQARVQQRIVPLLDGEPVPYFYDVIIDSVQEAPQGSLR